MSSASPSSSTSAPGGLGPNLRLYLVEDSPIIRENLLSMLQELVGVVPLGFADNEPAASAWLREHAAEWNLAIVDIFLKQGTGLSVLRACRERQPQQKMIVLSSYATPDIRKRCLALGADAVFDKTMETDDLVEYCRALKQG